MFKSFLKHYFELPQTGKNIVCLGGGVGTAQILKGLKKEQFSVSAIVSMADDGGSAGRVRRAFSVPPPGDLVNCLAALSDEESAVRQLFLYRFKGQRYGKDTDLGGQKLGNLIFVALSDIFHGDTNRALVELSKIISSSGQVLPATLGDVNIWAQTTDGKKVVGEQNIDLGNYHTKVKTLKKVFLNPADVKAYGPSLSALNTADVIIVGPGDLFSTVLPVVIVPQIKRAFIKSQAKKIFVVNIANKPFETTHFKVSHHLAVLKDHLGGDYFDKILINTNQQIKIPAKYKYSYVGIDWDNLDSYSGKLEIGDFVDSDYPLYHDSAKIASAIKGLL